MFSGFNISASGMTAQRLRMDIIANNIANIDTTRTETGGPYRRQLPVFEERRNRPFSFFLNEKMNSRGKGGVQVSAIIEDQSPFKIIYNPAHPDADEDGYVSMPNVDIVTEMVDMIDASRAYEANVTALNSLKNMALKALEIGKG
ncbi:MAG: flagellar basal body rod protein FlgC [Halanaerobiaceae bacterium]|nr:flagellar basal body rod protein FlgC [Halanaerobiaceae bacterium]